MGSRFRLKMPYWDLTKQQEQQENQLHELREYYGNNGDSKRGLVEKKQKTKRKGKSRRRDKLTSNMKLRLQQNLTSKNILIVDDSDLIRRILEKVLAKCGSITTAQNGETAVQLVKKSLIEPKHGFDLIFMDCLMPIMDGFEATRLIREMGFTKPIFALTGNSAEIDSQRMTECGFSHILVKPIRPDDLLELIASVPS
jgi:CheY-like chemotaxis protein